MQKLYRVFVVVQRFAAAHEHDVVDAPPFRGEHAVYRGHLPQHLPRRQVAHAAFERGGAEAAAHAAAHLRGEAEGVAVVVAHDHALDEVAVCQFVEQLLRVIEL